VSAFIDWADGEWHEPIHRGYKMACCDCGLVHNVDFKIRAGRQVQMRVSRNNRSTAMIRRHRNITVEH
jgi:uncharacterized Zn finger protein